MLGIFKNYIKYILYGIIMYFLVNNIWRDCNNKGCLEISIYASIVAMINDSLFNTKDFHEIFRDLEENEDYINNLLKRDLTDNEAFNLESFYYKNSI